VFLAGERARFRSLVAGRRFGKTFLSITELIRATAGKKDKHAWYIAPSYRQAKQVIWRDLKNLTKSWRVAKDEQALDIELRGGCFISVRGATNPDSLRGPGLDLAILDEFADIDLSVWEEIIRPMLSDRGGSALFIGTPKGRNHFYQLHQAALTKPDWESFSFTTLDGGRVPASEIEAARRDLDERTFRQEYMATFETWGGAAYYAFNQVTHCRPLTFRPDLPLVWALDFNIEPYSTVLAQRIPCPGGRDIIHVIDELVVPTSRTEEACEALLQRTERWTYGRPIELLVYGDPSGNNRDTRSSSTDYQIISRFFGKQSGYRLKSHVKAAHPLIRDRINAVNSMLRADSGEVRMFVDPKCKALIRDLEQVTYQTAPNGMTVQVLDKRDMKLTHVSDALGYFVETDFPITDASKGWSSNSFI
jgi:hypothetical protein